MAELEAAFSNLAQENPDGEIDENAIPEKDAPESEETESDAQEGKEPESDAREDKEPKKREPESEAPARPRGRPRKAPKDGAESDENLAKTKAETAGEIEAPVRWTADEKALFERGRALGGDAAKWAGEMQKAIADRDRDLQAAFTKKSQALAAERDAAEKQYGDLRDARVSFERYRNLYAHYGVTPEQRIGMLFELDRAAMADPIAFAKNFIAQRGITGEALGFSAGPAETIYRVIDQDGNLVSEYRETKPGERQPTPPQAAPAQLPPAVAQEFAGMRQRLATFEAEQTRAVAARHIGTVEEFRAAKDSAGNAKFPLFEDVRPQMAALIEAGAAASLEDAYHAAVAARPDLRASLMETERLRIRREMERAAAQEATRAKAAAASLPTGSNATRAADPDENITLEALIARNVYGDAALAGV